MKNSFHWWPIRVVFITDRLVQTAFRSGSTPATTPSASWPQRLARAGAPSRAPPRRVTPSIIVVAMCPAQRTLEDPRRIQQGSILRQHDLRDSIIHAESSLDLTQQPLHYRRNGGIVSAPAPIPSGRLHP